MKGAPKIWLCSRTRVIQSRLEQKVSGKGEFKGLINF